MAEDIVRVLRIIEYVGPRSAVEKQVERSLQGTRQGLLGVTIRAATIGSYPEILSTVEAVDVAAMPEPVPFEALPVAGPAPARPDYGPADCEGIRG